MTDIDFNPFLIIKDPQPLGPGSFEMALPLVKALNLQPGYGALFKKNTVLKYSPVDACFCVSCCNVL